MVQYHDKEYLKLVDDVLKNGVQKGDRTGTGTISVFGRQMRFDLNDGSIPLLTTKKMFTKGIIHELLWFLAADTNIKYLNDNGVTIWDEWADENGNLGPVYGKQWRKWQAFRLVPGHSANYEWIPEEYQPREIDQIGNLIRTLKTNPNDRRMIVSAWNVGDIDQMRLPPCHLLFQFYVANNKLSCQLYQRSCDLFLGVPFNIAQYSVLVRMIAQVTGFEPGEFIWTGGDVHLYSNHLDQANEQLKREPYPSPKLLLNPDIKDIDNFKYQDFSIADYVSHAGIKAEVSK